MGNDDIPKIKVEEVEESSDEGKTDEKDKESILVPQINPGKKKKRKGVGRFLNFKSKYLKVLAVVLGVLFIFVAFSGFLLYRVYARAIEVRASVEELKTAYDEQSLPRIKEELEDTRTSTRRLRAEYKKVLFMKYIPYFGGYISDGEHGLNAALHGLDAADIVVATIEPYSDIIGFAGEGTENAESGQETAQDRLDFVISTIPEVIPKTDILVEKMKLIRGEISQIDAQKYPEEVAGKPVRSRVERAVETADTAAALVEKGQPLLEAAPFLLGADSERTYLVLFQNDKELRPTGGFITAYSIASVDEGKFEPVSSNDIYNLDSRYTPTVSAPQPLIDYLKGPYVLSPRYRLRDMNWSPDFRDSMEFFLAEAEGPLSAELGAGGLENIDGIIAVDTELLVRILDVIGPIGVSGYGEFSTNIVPECNCPQVIYELESFADIEGPIVWSENEPGKIVYAPPNYDNRKEIIGPLMNSILANTLGQPKDNLPPLFNAIFSSLLEKHVLFYMVDEEKQEAVESFGIAGRIKDYQGDYLHISDANLGGRKSNLYATQEVRQQIDIGRDGTVTKTVEITYKNPEKHDGWLNSVLPNWVRIYVPEGSELIDFQGVENKEEPYDELGKTVYAGYFELRPLGVSKVSLVYKLPFKVDDEYKMMIQKQPGKNMPLYTIEMGRRIEEFFLKTDEEFTFEI